MHPHRMRIPLDKDLISRAPNFCFFPLYTRQPWLEGWNWKCNFKGDGCINACWGGREVHKKYRISRVTFGEARFEKYIKSGRRLITSRQNDFLKDSFTSELNFRCRRHSTTTSAPLGNLSVMLLVASIFFNCNSSSLWAALVLVDCAAKFPLKAAGGAAMLLSFTLSCSCCWLSSSFLCDDTKYSIQSVATLPQIF